MKDCIKVKKAALRSGAILVVMQTKNKIFECKSKVDLLYT